MILRTLFVAGAIAALVGAPPAYARDLTVAIARRPLAVQLVAALREIVVQPFDGG